MNIDRMRNVFERFSNEDRVAFRIHYCDSKGVVTQRTISPIRMEDKYTVLALCCGRAEPRKFKLAGIQHVHAVAASEVLMPEPVETNEVNS